MQLRDPNRGLRNVYVGELCTVVLQTSDEISCEITAFSPLRGAASNDESDEKDGVWGFHVERKGE
jgi:hypothetical protein